MKKSINLIILLFFVFLPVLLFSETDNPALSLNFNFGLTFIGQRGNNSEYISSVNPFPITPSHSITSVGSSFNIKLHKNILLGLNIEYSMNKKLTLTDPSDKDELIVDSLDFYNFYIDIKYMFKLFKLSSFISIGGGNNLTKGCDEKWTTTKKGYKIFLPEIDSRTSPILIIKWGMIFPVSNTFNLFTATSYYYLTKEKKSMLRISAGLSFLLLNNYRGEK
jgi:hypothetical protein